MDSHSVAAPPRSTLLALWLGAGAVGEAAARRALEAVQDDDEPHRVEGDDLPPDLPGLLAAWGPRTRSVTALLPVPGDLLGVPAQVSAAAAEAGECVLVETAEGAWAAVPDVEEFGSVLEPGYLVTWHVTPVAPWGPRVAGVVGSLGDAERELRGALLTATDALAALDVARWRDDAAGAIAALRGPVVPAGLLPPGLDPRRVRVLDQAVRLRSIVDLATADDGGAVNLWQADQRGAALRAIERAARRALSAVTTLP